MANIEVNGTNFVIEPCKSFEGCHVWKVINNVKIVFNFEGIKFTFDKIIVNF